MVKCGTLNPLSVDYQHQLQEQHTVSNWIVYTMPAQGVATSSVHQSCKRKRKVPDLIDRSNEAMRGIISVAAHPWN